MAFCRFCGSQIPDGTVCPCQQNAAPQPTVTQVAPQPQAQSAGEQAAAIAAKAGAAAKNAFNGFIPYLKAFTKAPGETVTDAVLNNRFSIALGFVAINALTLIIAIWSLLGSIVSLGTKASGAFGMELDIKLPVFRMIFGGILMSVAAIALCAVTLLIFAKIGKTGLTFKGAFIVAAFRSFWPSVLILGGTLIGLIGGVFGIIIAVLTLSFAAQMITVTAIGDINNFGGCAPSTTGKTFLVPILYAVAYGVICIVLMMLFSWCTSGVKIEGTSLGNLFELLEMLG